MALAARPAQRLASAHVTAPRVLVSLLAGGLALAPCRVLAEPAPAAPSEEASAPAPAADAAEPTASDPTSTESTSEAEPEPEAEEPDQASEDDPAEEADASDADATEDEETDDADADVDATAAAPRAEPLRPLQTAAWWTMFGAFSVGTTAGVLAGLAERQEDRATRLSTLFDAETGAQPLYADRQDEYEGYLRRGEGYARAAIGVGVVAGLTTAAAITLFAVDARRQRAERPRSTARAALRVSPGAVEVRF